LCEKKGEDKKFKLSGLRFELETVAFVRIVVRLFT